jgi:hypothetical protein
MTIDEFLHDLAKYANKVKWENLENRFLRCTDNGLYRYCPITFLGYTLHRGRKTSEFNAERAGIRLGLSRDDRWNIILASDWSELDLSKLRTSAHFDMELRNQLENILL